MTVIKVNSDQSLFDIALQYFGTVEAVYEVAKLNNLSITQELTVGQSVILPELTYPENQNVIKYFKQNNIIPNSASTQVGQTELPIPTQSGCSWALIEW